MQNTTGKKMAQASKKPNNSHVLITLTEWTLCFLTSETHKLTDSFLFSLFSCVISWRPIKNDLFIFGSWLSFFPLLIWVTVHGLLLLVQFGPERHLCLDTFNCFVSSGELEMDQINWEKRFEIVFFYDSANKSIMQISPDHASCMNDTKLSDYELQYTI